MRRALALVASLVLLTSGCAGNRVTASGETAGSAKSTAEWSRTQQERLQAVLSGTPYSLSQVNGGWLIRIAEKGTFNPQRPELLLPAALGDIGLVTRHLAQDPEVAVMVVGVATGQYKLKSKEQVSQGRAQSVASIFRLNRVPGHRLKTLSVTRGENIDEHLGVALLVVPEQELHQRVSQDQALLVAMLTRP